MTLISKLVWPLVAALALTACDDVKQVEIVTKPGQVQITQPDMPKPVKLYDVTFKVVTNNNVNQFIAEQKAKGSADYTFIAISIKDYENLAINLEELKRYIDQQKAVIVYYRTMTTVPETKPAK